jgi:hypothetical protein
MPFGESELSNDSVITKCIFMYGLHFFIYNDRKFECMIVKLLNKLQEEWIIWKKS